MKKLLCDNFFFTDTSLLLLLTLLFRNIVKACCFFSLSASWYCEHTVLTVAESWVVKLLVLPWYDLFWKIQIHNAITCAAVTAIDYCAVESRLLPDVVLGTQLISVHYTIHSIYLRPNCHGCVGYFSHAILETVHTVNGHVVGITG